MQILVPIARSFQLLFSIVVLGLSITLARQQYYGKVPAETGYAAFTGALGIVVSLIGIAALWVSSLSGIIVWVLDGVTSLALMVAGIVYAVALKGVSCSDPTDAWDNKLISGGCTNDDVYGKVCRDGSYSGDGFGTIRSRCKRAEADCAFMFLAFAACACALVASFLTRNK
ncbi:hypothetical protein N7478_011863 [Penicillium angulare]|uniref:uncharacterized protein n=1 Tax=Penicillium angulare TaxID=116970 RepID=UPI0025422ECF|nr:uncharacterized protein N7478_011863 [Penicillium angulare]KAJ5261268.1 hypothetical protein N7478_011863 [Penicillium angulare]